MNKGYCHIYTGNGKGKTTAAIGLTIRSLGHNKKVAIIQFMKDDKNYGEFQYLHDKILFLQMGRNEFVDYDNPEDIDIKLAKEALIKANEIVQSAEYDLVILDEINVAVMFSLIDEKSVLDIMKNKPESMELILTGRGATKEMMEFADLVTEMKEIKHYFSKGILGREGVEY